MKQVGSVDIIRLLNVLQGRRRWRGWYYGAIVALICRLISVRQHHQEASLRTLPNRPISAQEKTLVAWLLAHVSGAAPLDDQVDRLRVVAACECGCPSVEFALDDSPAPAPTHTHILVEAVGKSPEGVDVGVILWENEGVVSGLEVYCYNNESGFQVPDPKDLEIWQHGAA